MRNRSNLLVLLGIAFFVVGGIIVYVLTNDSGGGSSTAPPAPVAVVEAKVGHPAGSQAKDLIAKGNLKVEKVPAAQLVPGAVQSLNQLDGATFVQGFASRPADHHAPASRPSTGATSWPDGLRGAGHHPRLHRRRRRLRERRRQDQPLRRLLHAVPIKRHRRLPKAQLLLSGVRVLDVNQVIPANAAGGTADRDRPGPPVAASPTSWP